MSETGLTYDQFAVPAALADDVRCIWRLSGTAPPATGAEPIVPDGCAEIVLNFADRSASTSGEFVFSPGARRGCSMPMPESCATSFRRSIA